MRQLLTLLCLVSVAVPTGAQAPQYHVGAAQQPGQAISTVLVGNPGQLYASLVDAVGGPRTVFGAEFLLGLSPALFTLDAGALPPNGLQVLKIPTGAAMPTGMPIFLQSVVIDSGAPNGVFRLSDGESTVFYQSSAVMVENFRDPIAQGITGSFDPTVLGRLQGAPIRTRTRDIVPPKGAPFSLPILAPLNPLGNRAQMVYRAVDLGATGEEEVVTAIRWRPFQRQVTAETFQRLVIDVVHSHIVPDYSVNVFSALPQFPASGLTSTFAANIKPGDVPVRTYDGPYAIRAGALRADGYLPYPAPSQRFTYNGVDSMLLDFKVTPSPGVVGKNGQEIFLMVTSSPRPNARAVDAGQSGAPVNPFQSTTASAVDNALHALQIEFAKVKSVALSPWRAAPVSAPNYHQPSVAASVPGGGGVVVEYRGARSAGGSALTPWSRSIDFADGMPFLQYRVTLIADVVTGEAASIDAIVIPIN